MDTVSTKKRSETMRAIKSIDTAFEKNFGGMLANAGYKFKKNVAGLPGKPDIVFTKQKVVIFLDSCFWHGCKQHCRLPGSNKLYWKNKIERNRNRDKAIDKEYRQGEWRRLRIWEHQIKASPKRSLRRVKLALVK